MSFAAQITFLTRSGAQSGALALPWTSLASPQLPPPLPLSPDPVTEVPPPPAMAGAAGSAISAAQAVTSRALSLMRLPAFPCLESTCLWVCKIASLLRRPTGLAVGLALKELRPHRGGFAPIVGSPAPRHGWTGIRRLPVIDGAGPYTILRALCSHKAHKFATEGEFPAKTKTPFLRTSRQVGHRGRAINAGFGRLLSVCASERPRAPVFARSGLPYVPELLPASEAKAPLPCPM